MSTKPTKQECLDAFDAVCENIIWSWSGKSRDGKTIVMILWQDEFYSKDKRTFYSWRGIVDDDPSNSDKRLGLIEAIRNLSWAHQNCEGRFKVIGAISKKNSDGKKQVVQHYLTKLTMVLLYLDVDKKAFVAEIDRGYQ